MVYEYKYVVMNWDGTTAAAWQSGGNCVIALQVGGGMTGGGGCLEAGECAALHATRGSASFPSHTHTHTHTYARTHMPLLPLQCITSFLQWGDKEIEVFDNWGNNPGALVITDGREQTREKKLLAWAGDYAAQRAELTRTRAELATVGRVGGRLRG